MTCPKPRSAYRPQIENLESRLQPGSIITGQGYGWSLLADNLLSFNQAALESQSLVSQSSSESVRPLESSAPFGVHSNHQDIAVVPVGVARSEPSALPASNLVATVAGSLTNEDLGVLKLTGRQNAVPSVPAQGPAVEPLTSTPVNAGFVESPIGISTPPVPVNQSNAGAFVPASGGKGASLSGTQLASPVATPLEPVQPDVQGTAVPVVATPLSLPNLHVTVSHFAASGINAFASQPLWASYLGFSGEDRLLGTALSQAPGAAQPIVVTGFTQSTTDATEYDGLLATISTDGKSATVFRIGLGTGTRTEGHAVDVDAAGNMYVTGQIGITNDAATTTDVTMRVDPTGTTTWIVGLVAPGSGHTSVGNGLKLDSTGTKVYIAGGEDLDPLVAELDAATGTTIYGSLFPQGDGVSRIMNAIAVDSTGIADLGYTRAFAPDTRPGVGQVTADGQHFGGATFGSTGPKAGTFGVAVDAVDNFYITGGIGDNLANPPAGSAPAVDPTAGGASGGNLADGTYVASYTFTTAAGETLRSPDSASFTVAGGNIPELTLPALPTYATGINVYLSAPGGDTTTERRYNSSPITGQTFDLADAAVDNGAPPTSNTATTPYARLLIAKFRGFDFSQLYGVAWFVGNGGVRTADFIGRAIQVDSSGNALMAAVLGNSSGSRDFMESFLVGKAGNTDIDDQALSYGSVDDQNRALALDEANGVYYMVGFTASPDFNGHDTSTPPNVVDIISSSYQPTYGGDPYDGVIIQEQLPQ